MRSYIRVLILIIGTVLFISCSTTSIAPVKLTCEYQEAPVTDIPNPRLSWINENIRDTRGAAQSGYRIRVALSPDEFDSPVWDSGRILSDRSVFIEYEGPALASRTTYWWQVKVWDEKGKESSWSKPASWHVGILSDDEWKGRWIGVPWMNNDSYDSSGNLGSSHEMTDADATQHIAPAPLFRKSFKVSQGIREARFYGTGLGYFELHVNGQRIGDEYFSPNQTNYDRRPYLNTRGIVVEDPFEEYLVMYRMYDLTDVLDKGENIFGVILGNGFYNLVERWPAMGYGSPRFMGQIEILYKDGTKEIISSDESWKTERSAITCDQIFLGEHYDARLEHEGWSSPGYDDSSWENAVLRPAPCGKLVPQNGPADRIVKKYTPVSLLRQDDGSYKVKFPVEVSGCIALNDISAEKGQKIEIKYLSESPGNGSNTYIAKGSGKESYHARFTWFVFSEALIYGLEELSPDQVEAHLVCSDVDQAGEFRTSNVLLNQINEIWRQSQLDNMHGSIASDCPHRERSPYTGDGQIACATVLYNFNATTFYNKWIRDIRGAQTSDGYIPNSAPWQPGCGGGIGWGAAMEIIPWEFYRHYGDKRILEENFDAMCRHVRWMLIWVDPQTGVMCSQYPQRWKNLGDWLPPRELPRTEIVHTFLLWNSADIVVKVAEILGKDASEFMTIRDNAYNAFHNAFYDPVSGSYGKYGSNVLALRMGVPSDRREQVLSALRANIAEVNDHIDTGIIGTRYLFEVLCDNSLADLAYKIINQRDFPSFGWWIEQGATTTWENWDGRDSRNHPMFGGGIGWFYRDLAGLRPLEEGFRSFAIRPVLPDGLDWVEFTHDTTYGEIRIRWDHKVEDFSLECTIPVGTKATVGVPSKDGYQTHEVGSGKYVFHSKL